VTSGAAPPLLFDYDNFPPDAYQVACAACTMCLCSPMLLPMQSWSAPQALRSIVRMKGSGGASQYTYPAPGKPELARHVVDLLRRAGAPAAASQSRLAGRWLQALCCLMHASLCNHAVHVGAPNVESGLGSLALRRGRQAGIEAAENSTRGFDHGVFVPLKLAYPDANVPVVDLSILSSFDPQVERSSHAHVPPYLFGIWFMR